MEKESWQIKVKFYMNNYVKTKLILFCKEFWVELMKTIYYKLEARNCIEVTSPVDLALVVAPFVQAHLKKNFYNIYTKIIIFETIWPTWHFEDDPPLCCLTLEA